MSMLGSPMAGTLPYPQTSGVCAKDRLPGSRLIARVGLSISVGLAVTMLGPGFGAYHAAEQLPDCPPPAQSLINLVFIIDASGSLAPAKEGNRGRGQTYNVEIDGVRRALLDPSVIPRDGSVSVGAVLFDGEPGPMMTLTLTPPIRSDADAQVVAARIKEFRCTEFQIAHCPSGDTNFGAAIERADVIARSRLGARRVLMMSTDGYATDPDKGEGASKAVRANAIHDRVEAELDVILMGLADDERAERKNVVSRIVFPPPPPANAGSPPIDNDLPGAVEVIVRADCNEFDKVQPPTDTLLPVPEDSVTFEEGCGCQVRQFADFVRRALRSTIASRELTVTTSVDTAPGTPFVEGGPRSLRQAIETANANGGRATITFSSSMTIRPSQALPPLTAPDITICGCAAGCSRASIPDKVTCPQTSQSKTNVCDQKVTIDGQGGLEDGIVIRSNRDVVRGLIITSFLHAGIVIQPVCPSDNTGFNRIEHNTFEDNIKAGVCVLDPQPGQATAVTHNVGNTISENAISGSETPIDLGSAAPFTESAPSSICDGPTLNDAGDADAGPNTLLNFPEPFTAKTAGKTVTVTGSVIIPALERPVNDIAVVEVFAVTKIHPAPGIAVVDAVTFFGKIILDEMNNGAFSMTFTDLPLSPIDGYTATFTDRAGNTSELIPFCSGPPKPKLSPQSIEFARVDPTGKPNSSPQSQPFTIENCGCSKLDLSLISIERRGNDVGRFVNLDDSASKKGSGFFSVNQIDDSGSPVPISIPKNNTTIDPGKTQRFSVAFNPVIPRVIKSDEEKSRGGLFAKHVLPADILSALNFQTGSGDPLTINLIGHVTTPLKLIDPDAPANAAKITLTRSGDEFIVTFAIFDSNLDVNHLSFQFFDKAGQTVPLENPDDDLRQVIQARKLVTGQSFIIIKRFSNAKKHKEVGSVRVTVSDPETDVSLSGGVTSLTNTAGAQSLRDGQGAVLLLPTVRLRPTLNKNAPGAALPGPAVKRLNVVHNPRRMLEMRSSRGVVAQRGNAPHAQ